MREEFNYDKLRGRIREVYGTESKFAEALEIGRVSLSKRLNNNVDFTRMEIFRACELLRIDPSDVAIYFFTLQVQKSEPNVSTTP